MIICDKHLISLSKNIDYSCYQWKVFTIVSITLRKLIDDEKIVILNRMIVDRVSSLEKRIIANERKS